MIKPPLNISNNSKTSEKSAIMKTKKSAKRWRKWSCRFGENRYEEAQEDIATLSLMDFKAKIWSPLPQHKPSGHVHVSVLCTQDQLYDLTDLIEEGEIGVVFEPQEDRDQAIAIFREYLRKLSKIV